MPDDVVAAALSETAMAERARIVATLIRVTGDWDLAEDCVQDAFAKALRVWRERGVPANPAAWVTTVAKNAALDRLRRSATEAGALHEVAALGQADYPGTAGHEPAAGPDEIADDRLRLIFTCCHPALAMTTRVALTLRSVAGLSTAEIARSFLVPEPTMAKRLVRARAKIRNAGIPYRVPPPHLLAERTAGVFSVIYLLFNEGYSASAGDSLVREPLAREAIRLARLLVSVITNTPNMAPFSGEATSLLALMMLHHARADARIDDAGEVVTLEYQDRSRWDASAIDEGLRLLQVVEQNREPGSSPPSIYELQARIASVHMTAADAAGTDFARIERLYDALYSIAPSPVVELNRAVAVAMTRGAEAGLPLVEAIDLSGALDGYYLVAASRADLLRRLGRTEEAAVHYARARELAPTAIEKRYFTKRLVDLASMSTNLAPFGRARGVVHAVADEHFEEGPSWSQRSQP